jgi:hypothetical protein
LIYLLDKRLRNKRKILYDAPYGFPEIQLNLGMRDIEDISLYPLFPEWGTVTCRWAKPTADQVTLPHDSLTQGISLVVGATEHRHPISPIPLEPPKLLDPLEPGKP